jgi:hypothetical protein
MDISCVKVYVLDMPKVIVKKETSMDAEETFLKISKMLSEDGHLKKLDPKYICKFDENSKSGTAQGAQFKAEMSVKSTTKGSSVEIVVDLPFHLTLVKGVVESTLKKKVEEALT